MTYSEEVKEMVKKLVIYFKKERDNGGPLIPLTAVNERVSEALGISLSTVNRITGNKKAKIVKEKSKPKTDIDELTQFNIRTTIYDMHKKKQHVTLESLLNVLKEKDIINCSKASLHRILGGIGFRWIKDNPKEYIRNKRKQERQFVYLDETWIFENGSAAKSWQDGTPESVRSTKPESTRYVIVHAGNANGFIPGAGLIFSSKTKDMDYHGEMNHGNFINWFENNLLKNLEEPSLIVMDNARYHSVLENKIPNLSWTKNQLQEWLTERGITFQQEAFKKELLQIALLHKPKKTFIADTLAEQYGHRVLRLPPYHCVFNPIENIWGITKNYYNKHIGRDGYGKEKCLAMWKEALDMVTDTMWKNSIGHAEKIIQDYWDKEVGIERMAEVEPLIISLDSDSSEEDDFG